MNGRRRLALALLLVWIVCPTCGALAQHETDSRDLQDVTMLASVGYDGVTIGGAYLPLTVEITAGKDFSGTLCAKLLTLEGMYDTIEMPIEARAGETLQVHMPVKLMRKQNMLEVTIRRDGDVVAQTMADAFKWVDEDALIIGVLGGDALVDALRVTAGEDPLGRTRSVETVALSTESFPTDERELYAFDMLVMDAFDPGTLDERQQAIFKDWIEDGGFLLAGAGDGQTNAFQWLAPVTGIETGVPAEMAGAFGAVMDFAGVQGRADSAEITVSALNARQGQTLVEHDGTGLLTASETGKGLVMTAGFGLTHPDLLLAFKREALWQRLLTAYDDVFYGELYTRENAAGARFSYTPNQEQRVSVGVSMFPCVLLLAAYIVAGVALYAIAKRRDRSKALWVWLPCLSCACVALVACMRGALELNEPAATSFTVAEYDETGLTAAQEIINLSYASRARVRVSTPSGKPLARLGSDYFSNWSNDEEEALQERDRIMLGDASFIELPAGAPWLLRLLWIDGVSVPEGAVRTTAWMEKDGLHAEIVNDTATVLHDAVLLTRLGYTQVGEIEAGQTLSALIARPDKHIYDKNGYERIFPGTLLGFERSMYDIVDACVYPQEQTDDGFAKDALSEDERQALALQSALMTATAAQETGADRIACVLYARSDALESAALTLDGEPIKRTAHQGVVLARASCEPVGPTGYFYYPQGMFEAHEASVSVDGVPSMGDVSQERYVSLSKEPAFGFSLKGVALEEIEGVTIVSSPYAKTAEGYILSAYDFTEKAWKEISGMSVAQLSELQIRRFVSREGELFLRYSAQSELNAPSGVYVPDIIVEGGD